MVPNSSIYHSVPIKRQPQSWACWYTSFQMVVEYERGRGQGAHLVDPSEDPETKAIYQANKGIGATSDEREKIAKKLGFEVAFASMTAEGMWELLNSAPVIYAGRWPGLTFGHWVVLVGISESRLLINNPASGQESYDYNWFAWNYLQQTEERPLIHPYPY